MSNELLKVSIDEKQFRVAMAVFAKQIPFATSRAINFTAIDAQTAIRTHIHEAFTIRRKAFIDRSIKIKPFANKHSLSATLSVDAPGGNDVLSMHEAGGTKTSASGPGHDIAIPNTGVVRKSVDKVIPKRSRPRNLKNAIKVEAKDGTKRLIVRKGRGKSTKTMTAYRLVPSVHITPRLSFVDTGTATVQKRWSDNFSKAWNEAVDSAL